MADAFESYRSGLDSPGVHAAEVTPDDATDLANVARYLLVGVGGTIKITTAGGEAVSLIVPTGQYVWARVARVWTTGTDASSIVAFW